MIRFIRHWPNAYPQITGVLLQHCSSHTLTQINPKFSVLKLFGIIMGKVRNVAGTDKLRRAALNEQLTSSQVKRHVGEKLISKQHVKFKTKLVDAAGSLGSPRLLVQTKKDKLQNVCGVLKGISHKGESSKTVETQVKILSAEDIFKTKKDSKVSKKKQVKRVCKKKQKISKAKKHVRKSVRITNDVPLAVEMPKIIDACDIRLSDLNRTSEVMDTMSDTDSYTMVVSDSNSSDQKKDDAADIPLAVVMPSITSCVPAMEEAREEKQPTKVDRLILKIPPQDPEDQSGDLCNGPTGAEIEKSNTSSKNVIPQNDTLRTAVTKKDHDLSVFENIKVHLVGNSVLLQLKHPVQFFIFGQVKVQVLQGKIIILGYEMDNKCGSHIVSSLRGSSFVSIQTCRSEDSSKIGGVLPPGLPDKDILRSLISAHNSNDVWLLLREGNQDFLEYIQMYLQFPISVRELRTDEVSPLKEAQEALNCIIHPELTLGKRLRESESWKGISEKIIKEKKSCTVLCGGKGVGKSTLLRFLVNQVLSGRMDGGRGVVLLDCDPGQAELTPPGCVAVSVIKEPLLGPNYTHLQSSELCIYIGEISVTQCLGRYIEASTAIIKYFKESPHLSSLPCIVNTMGFTQGMGVTIMGQLLKLLKPTRVVQIDSKRRRENYPFRLTSHDVLSHLQSSDSRCIRESLQLHQPVRNDLCYEFVLLQSAAEVKRSKDDNIWGMKPRLCRDAVILSYFSSLVRPPLYSILEDIPYSCPLGTLVLCVADEQVPPNLILAALNGNFVALCTVDPCTSDVLCHKDPAMPRVLTKVPIAPCIGFGIVRGVDMEAKMLYLTTPLKEDKLSLVNCLVFGAVNLPTSVYITSTAPGLVPYVSSGHHPDLSAQ